MALTLYYHPLSSFCHKVLMALYEHNTAFTPLLIDLGNEESRNLLLKEWPIGKFPVLHDSSRHISIPETSIIIEYLQQHYPSKSADDALIPADPRLALETRLHDRFFDLYVNTPMGKVVADKLRPANQRDDLGVAAARSQLQTALGMTEKLIAGKKWIMGDLFTMADCAAASGLYFTNRMMPLKDSHPNVAAYLNRLLARPSYARTMREAEPYLHMFPG